MADEDNQTPTFQIQRIYLKDLSLEQPNSPGILLEQQQPQVEINLALAAEPVVDGIYEVAVTATVTTKVGDKTLFLVEAKQAGIFEIRNIPQEQLQQIIGIACPQIVYPYLRAIVSDVCTRAGFPPVLLTEVNFQAMYEAQRQQAAVAGNGNANGSANGNGTARESSPAPPERGGCSLGSGVMKLAVLGAGAWGTAIAANAAARHPTLLWARDPAQADAIRAERRNARYLAEVELPAALAVGADFDAALAHASSADDLIVVATPMAALESLLRRLPSGTPAGVMWLCKGFQQSTGRLGHEIARELGAGPRVGVLSGPSFAVEVARGQPTALVAASVDASLCGAAVAALHGDALRIYTSDDVVGVEVGGAVKNVLAIATGIADGLQLGLNARAAIVTRGLAEMTRLGVALGARAETFMGLSGLGDLVLTATGDLSRNRTVGLLLARGLPLARILEQLGHVAEGVACAATVLERAGRCGVEMPIAAAVVDVLQGAATPVQALERLMGRSARPEH